jgi:hypothetical protein
MERVRSAFAGNGSLVPSDLQGHVEQGVDRQGVRTTGPSQCQFELSRRGIKATTDDTRVRVLMS